MPFEQKTGARVAVLYAPHLPRTGWAVSERIRRQVIGMVMQPDHPLASRSGGALAGPMRRSAPCRRRRLKIVLVDGGGGIRVGWCLR